MGSAPHHAVKRREPWWAIRRELPVERRLVLMCASFVAPLLLWCAYAYIPAFHRDVRVEITAERRDPRTANLVDGDRVRKAYFRQFQDEARERNAEIIAQREADPDLIVTTRSNKKIMRRIQPVAEANGFLQGVNTSDISELDSALFNVWRGLAEETLETSSIHLSDENKQVVRDNWALMAPFAPYDSTNFVSRPLLHLVPQAKTATAVYLPAPHECIAAAIHDFTTQPGNNQPWMHQRLASSLKVVFGGFLMACLIGVPLGIMCGCYDVTAKLFEPFVDFFRYMPAPTFSLLLVAILGVEGAPKTALVFIGTFPHMVLMLANTTRLLDRSLLEAAQTLGARRGRLLKHVVIPGILPKLYNDLRVLLGWAWTWLVIAELIGTKTGLTGFIDTQGTRRNFDRVFPVIIMIGVIGFLTDQVLQMIARRLFPWEYAHAKRGFFATLMLVLRRHHKTHQAPPQPEPATDAEGAADVRHAPTA